MEKSYKEILPQIDTFIFDVDGVLTNGIVTVFPNGELVRQMNTKDGYALRAAVKAGFRVCIISGGFQEGTRKRLEMLDIEEIHLGVKNKMEVYNSILSKLNVSASTVIYMGDDVPDYTVMKASGISTCPKDACIDILEISDYNKSKAARLLNMDRKTLYKKMRMYAINPNKE